MVVNMETGDELIDIKNSFFTGNYQVCVNECQKHKVDRKIDIYLTKYFNKHSR